MRRTVTGFWWSPTIEGTPALIVTAAFFALGGLAGCLFACGSAEGGIEAMADYLDHFLAATQEGALNSPALPELLWRVLRWPFLAFLLGFTALGLICIPALTSLRGFLLAFSIASFAQAYGRSGVAMAFLLLGVPALAYVPAFLLLSVQSFSAACSLGRWGMGQGRRELPYHRDYFLRCGVCAAAVFAGTLMERYLVPMLVMGWANTLRT